jgi:replication-associated recombination protein RarA
MCPLIANTIHNVNPFICVSALQKFIRRGMEREAQEVAAEMIYTSKPFTSWVCKRLQVISHEDVGLAAPELIQLVRTCCEQAKEWWDAKSEDQGLAAMVIGTAIRALCRAKKSREGDHFQCAVGFPLLFGDKVFEIPEWVYDKHSIQGRKLGRGIDYFREVSAVLSPAPAEKDAYEDEAYRLWKLRETREAGAKGKKEKGQDSGSGTKERGVKTLF